jgi:hypothetical protein
MVTRTCRSPLVLSTVLVVATACSPACTPPDPAPDITQQRAGGVGTLPMPAEMIMEAPGVDLGKLDDAQRRAGRVREGLQPRQGRP